VLADLLGDAAAVDEVDAARPAGRDRQPLAVAAAALPAAGQPERGDQDAQHGGHGPARAPQGQMHHDRGHRQAGPDGDGQRLQVEQERRGQAGQDPLGRPGRAEQPPAGGHGKGGHRHRGHRQRPGDAQDGPLEQQPLAVGAEHEGEGDQERRQV
jgi:hypothetical protein